MNYFDKINFVADTYDGLITTLKGMTKDKLGDAYEDFSNDDVATLIMEWMAFVGSSVSWSSDRKLSDNIIELTRSLKVATILAESEGLKLFGRTPQSVTVNVISTTDTTIPVNSIVRTSSGNFVTLAETKVFAYDGTVNTIANIDAIEATKYSLSKQITGESFQKIDLSESGLDIGQSIVNKSIVISFYSEEDDSWSEVDYFTYDSEKVFTVDYINNYLKFGDNITGTIPPEGSINISFLVTRGLDIDIPQLKNGDVSAILDPDSEEEISVSILSNSQGRGASLGDLDLDRIKELYKGFKSSRQSCLSTDDFENFAMRTICNSGRVGLAKAYVWRDTKQNSVILQVKKEMSLLFLDFIEKLKRLQLQLQSDIISFKEEMFKLKTFLSYMKILAGKLDTQLDELKGSYKTTLGMTQSAIEACKQNGKTEIDTKVTNDFYYDFSSEKNIMDDAFSQFGITITAFDKLTDIEGRTIDDYIVLINEIEEKFKIDIDETLDQKYKTEISRLFKTLDVELQNLLYSPETASIINLVILVEDTNGDYVRASNALLQELYNKFIGNYDPSIILNLQDGYSSILSNILTINVKLKEVDTGYSKEIIKTKIKQYLGKNYKRLDFGEGLTVYEVINDIETNVKGVKKAGVQFTDSSGELYIDDFGDLDMSEMTDILIQNIKITVE